MYWNIIRFNVFYTSVRKCVSSIWIYLTKLVHSEMKIQMRCYHAKAKCFCQFNTCPLSTKFDVTLLIQKPSLTTYRILHNSKYLFYTMYKYLRNQLPHFFKSKTIHFTFSVRKTGVTFQCIQWIRSIWFQRKYDGVTDSFVYCKNCVHYNYLV
jgi:hypothetical protein